MTRFLSRIKALVVPSGSRVRPIQFGVFRGLKMDLDLQSQTQIYAGLFERELYDWVYRLAKHIRTGIDAGAGQGEYRL